MAYNENLADRIREALLDVPNVEEKRMFQGLNFLVNKKMCISVRNDEILCRIDPAIADEYLEQGDCRPMEHNGKVKKGFIFVNEMEYSTSKKFSGWINLCLEYNIYAKYSKKLLSKE